MIRLAAAAILALPLFATGQTESELGIIAGTVTESGIGKPIGEVAITVRGLTLATTTDAGGRYSLRLVPPGDHVVIFSRAGFTRAVVENVRVAPGLTTRADYALKPQYYEMDPFEVIAPPYEEQTVALLEERKDSAVMMDAIGSEFLSKVGASDAGEAVSKVAGAAVVDGKYAVIRGLNDRYSGSLLNNAEIPSSDPYRKGAQLDMFPTAMIESIQVSKTFTPDQPGQRTLTEFGFPAGVYAVGRLDMDSEGLLLLSDEAGFNHRLLDPKTAHPRTYLAQVEGIDAALARG